MCIFMFLCEYVPENWVRTLEQVFEVGVNLLLPNLEIITLLGR